MEEKENLQNEQNLLRRFLFLIRRYIVLILSVVILVTALGTGYSYIRKPSYTSSVRVSVSISGSTSATVNDIRKYIDTIVDFCDEGVVVDRANDYYKDWLDDYKNTDSNVINFYNSFEKVVDPSTGMENELFKGYERPSNNQQGTLADETFILASSINTETVKHENATSWVFNIKYSDKNSQESVDKLYILLLAYKHELDKDNLGGQYFKNLSVNIENLGINGINKDLSKKRIVIISFLISVVLALALVYVINLFDKTVKDRVELSKLTGVQVVGCISYLQEKENGK